MALVLGSGGARGYAHIGVIHELIDRDVDIVGVAGSSMGALVGGLYAAGVLGTFERWATGLTQRDILRLVDPSITASGGMLRAERVLAVVRDIIGDTRIEDLPIPFTAVATDLIHGRSIWYQRGPLDSAIRASIAIPGVITPHVINGRLLADGGILDPLPLGTVASMDADLVIAVDVAAGSPVDRGNISATAAPRPVEEWIERFRRGTDNLLERELVKAVRDRFRSADAAAAAAAVTGTPPPAAPLVAGPPLRLGQREVLNRALDLLQTALSRHRIAADPPDVLIEVPRTAARTIDFHRASELIAIGRERAAVKLDQSGYSALTRRNGTESSR